MLEWLQKEGGELNKSDLHEFNPGNYGIIATEDIKEGELVAFIPRALKMTKKEARKSENAQYLIKKNISGNEQELEFLWLNLFIMDERRNPNSKWADYIALLP